MNRPHHIHSLPSTHAECGALAVAAEDVLPEYALLRLLHEWHVRGEDVDPDIEFALQLSSAIAARQSLEPPSAAEPTPEDATDMTDEVDTSPVDEPEVRADTIDADAAVDLPDIELDGGELDGGELDGGELDGGPTETSRGGPDLGVEELAELLADTALQEDAAGESGETFGEAVTFSDGETESVVAEALADPPEPTDEVAEHGRAQDADDQDPASAETPAEAPQEAEANAAAALADEPQQDAVAVADRDEPTTTDASPTTNAGAAELDPEPAPLVGDDAAAPDAEPTSATAAAADPVEVADDDPAPVLEPVIEELGAEPTFEQDAAEPMVDAEPQTEIPAAGTATTEPIATGPGATRPGLTQPGLTDSVEHVDAAQAAQGEEFALTNGQLDRVQDFLGELKGALIEMAQRPQPAPAPQSDSDIKPLVEALQQGFDRSAEQASQTTVALASLTEHVTQLGQHVEGGVSKTLDKAFERAAAQPATALPAAPSFVDSRSNRQTVVLGAVAMVILGWSILFWIKTGSPRLALGTLVGANAVACCMLLARRCSS
ncbi:MAG: hypothetical protein ACE37K_16290 [Planctomycetota bacterium]